MGGFNSGFSSPQFEQAIEAALLQEKSSYNITQDKGQNYASLTEAIAAVSDEKYKVNGLVLTFFDGENWMSYRYNGADASGFSDKQNWSVEILKADDEDIEAVGGLMKFKDKQYEPENFSGLGRKYLRKNIQEVSVPKFDLTITNGCTSDGTITVTLGEESIEVPVTTEASTPEAVAVLVQAAVASSTVEGAVVSFQSNPTVDYSTTGVTGDVADNTYTENRNVLTQEMINEPNTVYIIQYDYNLNGEILILPSKSIIYYDGGSTTNGIIRYENGTRTVKTGTQKGVYYLEDFIDYKEDYNPADMRDFLQRSMDYTAANGSMLIFPANKIFVVEILPNPDISEEQWGIKRNDGTYALSMPSNLTVDLNGSTLQVATNKFASYNLIRFSTDCNNACIQNGWLRGDRDTHIIPANSEDKTHEWNYIAGVYADDCKIQNCKISDVRGDGLFIESYMSWEHTNSIILSSFTDDKISDEGVVSACEDGTCKLSPIHNVSYLYEKGYNSPTIKIYAKTGTYNISPFIDVHYYEDEAGINWLGHERIFYGDMSTMIEQLKPNYIRFMISGIVDLGDIEGFWVMGMDWKLRQTIYGCDIFNCGRNGVVITTTRFTLVDNCYIHDIGGTNNEVGIDIEGTSPYNGQCIISNTLIERCGVIKGVNSGASIAIPQGTHILIDNCIVHNISGRGNEIYVKNSVIKSNIELIPNTTSSVVLYKTYTHNKIENCRVYGYCLINQGVVENCQIYGEGITRSSINTNMIQSIYKSCVFNGETILHQCKYIDCKFEAGNNKIQIYGNDNNLYTELIRCDIRAKGIERSTMSSISYPRLSMYNCNFVQTTDFYVGIFSLLLLDKIINNTFTLVDYQETVGQSGFYPCYKNSILSDNIFICNIANRYFNFIPDGDNARLVIKNNLFINTEIKSWLFRIDGNGYSQIYNNELICDSQPTIIYAAGTYTDGGIYMHDNNWVNKLGGSQTSFVFNKYRSYSNGYINDNANNNGSTEQRPVLKTSDKGFQYYDTTLDMPIWWNGTNWVDSDDNIVDESYTKSNWQIIE